MRNSSTALHQLLELAGAPIAGPPHASDITRLCSIFGERAEGLVTLLTEKNGFYAFEDALHVLPLSSGDVPGRDLLLWNNPATWTNCYQGRLEGKLFFAEDVFGGQLCLDADGSVLQMDPETGDLEFLSKDLQSLASKILADTETLTGRPIARAWKRAHGELVRGNRLVPKTLFCMGGEYSIDNLYSVDAVVGMRSRADIARQIAHLPDGTRVELKTE